MNNTSLYKPNTTPTNYTSAISKSFNESLIKAIATVAKMKGRFVDEEEAYNNNKTSRLLKLLSNELKIELEKLISRNFKKVIKDNSGIDKIKIKVTVDNEDDLDDDNESVVKISEHDIKKISIAIIKRLNTYCQETYPHGLLVNGLFRALEMTGKKTNTFVKAGIVPVKPLIHKFIVKISHELSAITQYQSISNTTKIKSGITNTSSQLYHVSPDEVAAFAHSFATQIAIKMGVDKITNPNKLPNITRNEIKHHVTNTHQRPKSTTESGILKRYIKLVYLELLIYIKSRSDALSALTGEY